MNALNNGLDLQKSGHGLRVIRPPFDADQQIRQYLEAVPQMSLDDSAKKLFHLYSQSKKSLKIFLNQDNADSEINQQNKRQFIQLRYICSDFVEKKSSKLKNTKISQKTKTGVYGSVQIKIQKPKNSQKVSTNTLILQAVSSFFSRFFHTQSIAQKNKQVFSSDKNNTTQPKLLNQPVDGDKVQSIKYSTVFQSKPNSTATQQIVSKSNSLNLHCNRSNGVPQLKTCFGKENKSFMTAEDEQIFSLISTD